jgi:hypothetical protein
MANEFKHKSTASGDKLSVTDWEAKDTHQADGQVVGDILYFDGSNWIRKPSTDLITGSGTIDDLANDPDTTTGLTYGYKAGSINVVTQSNGIVLVGLEANTIILPDNMETLVFLDIPNYMVTDIVTYIDTYGIEPTIFWIMADVITSDNQITSITDLRNLGSIYAVDSTGWAGGTLPEAQQQYRGRLFTLEGDVGVADKIYICLKQADDSYMWVEK